MIGKILGNRYEVIEKIGDGGMAEVYRAHCHVLDRDVAIKMLKQDFVHDEDFVKKFKRESLSAASLNHPNIVNIFDIGEEMIDRKIRYYIVMEYINGPTLKDTIKRQGRLSEITVVNFAIQIASALQHAHSHHIIHRDIKPQNILMTKEGILKVADFGIARATTSNTVTTTNEAFGSVHYFSPEQARGQRTTEQSDIYSLGIVMNEMVTGKLPFDGDTPVAVGLKHIQGNFAPPSYWVPNISKSLEKVILKCMQKSLDLRYSNMTALLEDLNTLQNYGLDTPIQEDRIDDTKTQVIPTVRENEIKRQRQKESQASRKPKTTRKKPKKESGKKNGLMTVLGIIVALVVVFGMFTLYQRFLERPAEAQDVEVPTIIGMDSMEAANLLESEGLYMEIESTVSNDDFGPNEVVSINNTHQGNTVRKGFTVKVSINSDEELIEVPNVTGISLDEARRIIDRTEGISIGEIVYEETDDEEEDEVLGQFPVADDKVPVDTEIDLKVAKASEVNEVPNVVTMQIDRAREIMEDRGFLVETYEEESEIYEEGIVTWQEIDAGTELEKGTTILLYVSSGKIETVEEPIVDEQDNDVEYNYEILPDEAKESFHVVIIKESDGGESVVFERTIYYDDDPVNVKLSGQEGDKFSIYYDNQLEEVIP